MKQFNLEQALQGRPVVTREGELVTQLKSFEVAGGYSLVGVVDNVMHSWLSDGRYNDSVNVNAMDLFMEEEELYVFIHPDALQNIECITLVVHPTKHVKSIHQGCECYKLVKV